MIYYYPHWCCCYFFCICLYDSNFSKSEQWILTHNSYSVISIIIWLSLIYVVLMQLTKQYRNEWYTFNIWRFTRKTTAGDKKAVYSNDHFVILVRPIIKYWISDPLNSKNLLDNRNKCVRLALNFECMCFEMSNMFIVSILVD